MEGKKVEVVDLKTPEKFLTSLPSSPPPPLSLTLLPASQLGISKGVTDIAACLPNIHSPLLLSSQILYIMGTSIFLAKRDISQLPMQLDMVI